MSNKLKRHLISASNTFLAGFAAELLVNFNNITFETLADGSIYAMLFVALRAGIKAILEGFLLRNKNV